MPQQKSQKNLQKQKKKNLLSSGKIVLGEILLDRGNRILANVKDYVCAVCSERYVVPILARDCEEKHEVAILQKAS